MTIAIADGLTYQQALAACRLAIVQQAIARCGAKNRAARELAMTREGLHKILRREATR